MMTDAIKDDVSAKAEEQAVQQNAVVAQSEVEAAATVSTETAVDDSPLELDPDEEDAVEPVRSARDIKMDEIHAKRAKQREQGTQPKLSNSDLGLPESEEAGDQGGTVTLKVKGRDQDFSAEKVLDAGKRALQKESSADVLLEEAGNKNKAADVRMSDLDVREQNVLLREQEFEAGNVGNAGKDKKLSVSTDVSSQDELSDDEADGIVDDLYSGDKKKARDAVKEIDNRARGNAATSENESHAVTAEDVANVVERRAVASKSLTAFNTTYPDIANDKNLQNIVNAESHKIKREHPEYNQHQLLMASGKFVADKYGSTIVDDSGFQEKAARKAQSDSVSGADVTRRPQKAKKQTTRKEAIADMKKTRR